MEDNFEVWREIRGRADSVANAVFVLGGGAVSISIATLLGSGAQAGVSLALKQWVVVSWGLLGYSVISSLIVKFLLIVQAYKLLSNSPRFSTWHSVTTYSNWCLAITGIASFVAGNVVLIYAASAILIQCP